MNNTELGEESPFESWNVASEDTESNRSPRWKRLLRFLYASFAVAWEDMRTRIGLFILTLFLFMGTVGVIIFGPPQPHYNDSLIAPFTTIRYILGTDGQGRDMLTLTVASTPAMLQMMLAGAIISTGTGAIVGMYSGYKGGFVDRLFMGLADVIITLPGLPVTIVLAMILEPREPAIIGVLLAIDGWGGFARTLRSQMLTLRDEAYIESARVMGLSTFVIVLKDIVPNMAPYIAMNFVNSSRRIIFGSVGLYFLGILPVSSLNWGLTMDRAYHSGGALFTLTASHWFIIPMATITLLSIGLVLLAQGLDRVFNPRLRARHSDTDDLPPESG